MAVAAAAATLLPLLLPPTAGAAGKRRGGDPTDWSSPGLAAPVDESAPKFFKTAGGVPVQVLAECAGAAAAALGQRVLLDFVVRRSNGYFIYSTVEGVSFQPGDVPTGPVLLSLVRAATARVLATNPPLHIKPRLCWRHRRQGLLCCRVLIAGRWKRGAWT